MNSRRSVNIVHEQAGFTLVELVIAITLFSMIMLLLAGSFHYFGQVEDKTNSQASTAESLRQARAVLMRYLAHAQPVLQQDQDRKRLLFTGKADSLTFVASMPAHLGEPGLYEIRLAPEFDGEHLMLRFERQLLHPQVWQRMPDEYALQTVSLDGFTAIEFEYHAGVDTNPGWDSQWRSSTNLPQLVRLRFLADDQRIAQMTIRLMATPGDISPVLQDHKSLSDLPVHTIRSWLVSN